MIRLDCARGAQRLHDASSSNRCNRAYGGIAIPPYARGSSRLALVACVGASTLGDFVATAAQVVAPAMMSHPLGCTPIARMGLGSLALLRFAVLLIVCHHILIPKWASRVGAETLSHRSHGFVAGALESFSACPALPSSGVSFQPSGTSRETAANMLPVRARFMNIRRMEDAMPETKGQRNAGGTTKNATGTLPRKRADAPAPKPGRRNLKAGPRKIARGTTTRSGDK
jgi:hypothetical protein